MAQSPELAGGAGFTFEDSVSASYLVALLAEGYAPGIEDRVVVRVALQQRDFGEPLDDVIVDARDAAGAEGRLSLQVKRALTISAAASNSDFREIVRDCLGTLAKPDFGRGVDRFGAAVGTIAQGKARALTTICERARQSLSSVEFDAQFAVGGNASQEMRTVRQDVLSLIEQAKGAAPTAEEVHAFFAHFTLVELDPQHLGGTARSQALTRIRDLLQPAAADQAPGVWGQLCQLARNAAGASGQFDRPRLVRELGRTVRLRGAPSLRGDLERLGHLARDWANSIDADVGGTRLNRPGLSALLAQRLSTSRLVQIRGLPGSGKSVLIRQAVEADLSRGPVLLLKSDRLEGRGWNSFATANGLSGAPLETLLSEVASLGSSVLYIDGIDRVEKDHQPIILDVVGAIVRSPLLADWKIVVSLRDTGIEPLRNWMGRLIDLTAVQTVAVGGLNCDEAKELAAAKPHLKSLLFGSRQVREIVRRPFFAKVLDQSFRANGPQFEPQSEVDLINHWWERGGYNSSGQNAVLRQRALVEIGALRVRHLSAPISVAALSGPAVGVIADLVADGIVQHIRSGHTFRFSHDIFAEWAFFHLLLDRGADWHAEVRKCGEPPAIARVVELLSQSEYANDPNWEKTLRQVDVSNMRSQWTRSWLLGPLAAANFERQPDKFTAAVSADDWRFLKKALVWFQAEKTTPNQNILAGSLPQEQRVRFADLLGWPSDFAAWGRLIWLLLSHVDQMPASLYPDVVSVFEVWQNALAGLKNATSDALLAQCARWLGEIDRGETSRRPNAPSERWQALDGLGHFRKSLSALVLRSAAACPELTTDYLNRLAAFEDLRGDRFQEVAALSPILAQTHAELLVDLSLKHLEEELPDEKLARERRERNADAERRKRALAIPEDERTRDQQLVASGAFSALGFASFSYHDFEQLSLERDLQNFFPPSPLREPFRSLFQHAPDQALRLLRELSNHAITAWRQLCRLGREHSPGTPIPLDIVFPWGVQRFWGGDREYLWHRGMWAPEVLASAYMALEDWCFDELERGADPNALIQKILDGNECVAILGTAVGIALQSELISETGFSLVTAQRLWAADHNRMVQDLTSSTGNLIGFRDKSDLPHIEAIQAANGRSIRKKRLCWLVPVYILNGGTGFSERMIAAVQAFKDDLPYQIEEHRNLPAAREHLASQAAEYAELADLSNYHRAGPDQEDGRTPVVHLSPSAAAPEKVARVEEARSSLMQGKLWMDSSKAFETGQVDLASIAAQLEAAQRLDASDLFENATTPPDDHGTRRGAVAGTAAIILKFRDGRTDEELDWARDVLDRALSVPEPRDAFWSSSSVIPWHHGIFAARGLAADLRAGTARENAARDLLELVAHPLEGVSLAALQEALGLWDIDPKLGWCAAHIAFSLCHIHPQGPRGPSEPIHTARETREAVEAALRHYNASGWPDLPLPPPAWVKVDKKARRAWSTDEFTEDDAEGGELWGEPPTLWHSQYAAKVIALIPAEAALLGNARPPLLNFAVGGLAWTTAKLSPPWVKPGRRDRGSHQIFEWVHAFGSFIGRTCGPLPVDEADKLFLQPVFALEDDACWSLLGPLTDVFVCRYVYDAQVFPADAMDFLDRCLGRTLQAHSLSPDAYRAGQLSGFHQPNLARTLMFISVERADLAERFVNGDWSQIELILPLVDRFVRATGWAVTLMDYFLTLCERAKAAYPAVTFADQILYVLTNNAAPLRGWHGTFVPARIAALVQHFADRETPMPLQLGQKLLRILDLLVDMGDRRSAALQLSESFREIQMPVAAPA